MCAQPCLFLGHIKLLYIEYKFLLETATVIFNRRKTRQLILKSRLYPGDTFLFKRVDLLKQTGYVGYLPDKKIKKLSSLGNTELNKSIGGPDNSIKESLEIGFVEFTRI